MGSKDEEGGNEGSDAGECCGGGTKGDSGPTVEGGPGGGNGTATAGVDAGEEDDEEVGGNAGLSLSTETMTDLFPFRILKVLSILSMTSKGPS